MTGDPVAAAHALLDPDTVVEPAGRAWATAWTNRVDRALETSLRSFMTAAGARSGGVSLIALGSYARRTLCPRSDIDVMLVHDGWSGRDLEALVRAVCYPLWDAGLSVGHSVRTTKEAIRATSETVDTATALTERRLVAGSKGIADDLSGRVTRWLRRSGGNVAQEIVTADAARHERYGRTAGALEPDLKDGIGGLRDVHSLRWAGAILLGRAGIDPLVGARYLGAGDRSALARAADALLEARCALHLVGGKAIRNQLRLDLQDEVAEHLGMDDGDVLLRKVGLATRTIAHLHARTWPVLLKDATAGRRRRRPSARLIGRSLSLVDGLIEVSDDATVVHDPSLGLRAVAAAATARTVIARRSAMRLQREVEATGSLPMDEEAREALLTVLQSGPDGLPAMADADYLGLFNAHLPEWGRVRGRPQRNPLHTYDVDTHAMQAAAYLAELASGARGPVYASVWRELEDPASVVLGTWLHDVGKAWPGDHSIAGETVGRDWAVHMGFGHRRADRIAKLIRWHLLLPDTATQRDIDDIGEIRRVALAVGDLETLNGLYLLTYADSRATGKAAWSDWKDLLITRLYDRVRAELEGEVGVLARPVTSDIIVRAAAEHDDVAADQVRTTVRGLPRRYLRVASHEQVSTHTRLLHDRGVEPGELLTDVRDGPTPATQILSLVGQDRRGMVADCLGVLSANRVDVLEARVFTHDDGTALDWFVVNRQGDAAWERIVPVLQRVFAGEEDVEDGLRRRERARDARPPVLASPVPISITVHPADRVTRIEVRGPDGPGVLYRLTRAVSEMGLSLLGARIATLGPEVRDSFFVRGDTPPLDVVRKSLTPAFERAEA